MKLSPQGLDKIKQREGVVLSVYLDSGKRKTAGMGHLLVNSDLQVGDKISQAQSDAWAVGDIAVAESAVSALVTVPLTQNQFDALVSFVFNIGVNNFRSSTLLRLLNNEDYTGAKEQFIRWHYVTVNGIKIADDGLINRRISEASQFGSGISDPLVPPLKSEVAPPPTKVLQTTTGKLQATAVVTGGSAAVIQGINSAQPLLDGVSSIHSAMYGMPPWLIAVCGALVAACIGACVATLLHKNRSL